MPRNFYEDRENQPMAEAKPVAPNDIPLNKMCFFVAVAVIGAFCFFQLSSCTSAWLTTPAYVQAIQACNDMTNVKVNVKQDGKIGFDTTQQLSISSEVLSTIAKCQENVRDNFMNGSSKPEISKYVPTSLGGNLKELLGNKPE